VILPSVLIIIFILLAMGGRLENPWVDRFFTGASGAVAAQIAYASILFGKSVWRDVISLVVAILCFTLVLLTDFHPLLIVLIALIIRFILPHRGDRSVQRKTQP
jgi:chromate transport protein ChrA